MTTISNSAVAWAANRGIGKETLDRFGVGSGTAGMPPDGHRCEIIIFPYQRGTTTVNWKGRALGNKVFKQKTGGELRFFNLDAVLAGTRQYADQVKRDDIPPKYVKYPAGWLRAKRWLDEDEAAGRDDPDDCFKDGETADTF